MWIFLLKIAKIQQEEEKVVSDQSVIIEKIKNK